MRMVLGVLLILEAREISVEAWVAALGDDDVAARDEAQARLSRRAEDLADLHALLSERPKPRDADHRARLLRISARLDDLIESLRPLRAPHARPVGELLFETGNSEDVEIHRKLRDQRITLDMKNVPLTAVVDYFREISGLNIHIDGEVTRPDEIRVSVHEGDASLLASLRRLLDPLSLACVARDGVLFVTTRARLRRELKLELYDVQDLVEDNGEGLAQSIAKRVCPGSWKEEGKSIQFNNGLLIVRQSRMAHAAIRIFLRRRRSGEPDEEPRSPSPESAARLARLEGTDAEAAEAEIGALLRDFAPIHAELRRALAAGDAERRARAAVVLERLTAAASPVAALRDLESAVLRARVGLPLWGVDEAESAVCAAFSPRLLAQVRILDAVTDLPGAAEALRAGKGIAALQGGSVLPGGAIPANPEAILFSVLPPDPRYPRSSEFVLVRLRP